MYLHEYQSKQLFARYGIPTPQGKIAENEAEAFAIASDFTGPVVVNAQTLANQRIFRLAQTPQEAQSAARDMFATSIQDVRIGTILIEPAADVSAEFFLGLYADRGSSLLMFASTEGGSTLDEIERSKPNTLLRETINPLLGVLDFQARNLANGINLPREHWNAFTQVVRSLYRCCLASDAVRAEINPLALTHGGTLVALGGRLEIDDNALFRQPELATMRDIKAEHESTVQARKAGISYVRLKGTIGCIVSGAGLGMATLDLLAHTDESAANFLDLRSDVSRDKLSAALRLILPDAQAVLVNIFADKTTCVQVANDLLAALDDTQPNVPLVIRLAGQEADEAETILRAANLPQIILASSTSEAVRRVTSKGSADVHSGR